MGTTNNPSVSTNGLTLFQIATETKAGQDVFRALGERQRFRRRTDISRLYSYILAHIDVDLSEANFLKVFMNLESIGAGKLIQGRKNSPHRFKWFYNLKDIAQAAKDNKPLTDLQPLTRKVTKPTNGKKKTHKQQDNKRGPGRPRKYPVPVRAETNKGPSSIQVTLNLPRDTKPEDIKAFLELAKTLQH